AFRAGGGLLQVVFEHQAARGRHGRLGLILILARRESEEEFYAPQDGIMLGVGSLRRGIRIARRSLVDTPFPAHSSKGSAMRTLAWLVALYLLHILVRHLVLEHFGEFRPAPG